MAVALTALSVALGGTGYAATQLPGTHDVQSAAKKKKKNTAFGVTQATTLFQRLFAAADDSGKDLTGLNAYLAVTPVPNAKHATAADSATTATNATNATNATDAANANQLGGVAASSYQQYGSTLPPGQTLTGEYAAWGAGGGAGGGYIGDHADYRIPLSHALDSSHYQFIATSGATTPQCTGLGHAASGYLCVYQQLSGAATYGSIYNSSRSPNSFTLQSTGFSIYFTTSGTTGSWSYGGWSVTG
jgi:hypothetical protein